MAADCRAELPDGILLADIICRTVCPFSVQTDIPFLFTQVHRISFYAPQPHIVSRNFSVMDADTPDNIGIIASQDLGLLSADRISVH